MGPIWALQMVTAWLLLWPASANPWAMIPGAPASAGPASSFYVHALVHARGLLGATHARSLLYPAGTDPFVLWGFPLDALASRPFAAVLGQPAGYTCFAVVTLAAAGAAMAWLAGRWWRSRAAALVGAAAYQTGGLLAWELTDGHPGTVLAAALLPLALGQLSLALVDGRPWRAALAGLLAGTAALSCWVAGGAALVALAILAALAWLEGRLPWRPVWIAALAGLALVALPALHVLAGAGALQGIPDDPWGTVERAGSAGTWAGWIATRGLSLGQEGSLISLRPTLALLIGAGLFATRVRRWAAPGLWAAAGAVLAIGVWLPLPGETALPGPQLAVVGLPLFEQLTHPYRALLLTLPALALLAAGGAAVLEARLPASARRLGVWLGFVIAVLLVVEGILVGPHLPVAATKIGASRGTPVLAQHSGPALVLPFAAGPLRAGASMVIDQVFHGRPLVNGPSYPADTVTPSATFQTPAEDAIAYLAGCEKASNVPPVPDRAQLQAGLQAVGLTEVYLDLGVAMAQPHGERYLVCVEEALGSEFTVNAPLRIYELGATSTP
ncbi:MAG: hypothetical protein QGH45_23180 [Myxococcota bacterium]|jgi:hypothetical protein|nr:hypothetical protein [Myxococcota bacterium]